MTSEPIFERIKRPSMRDVLRAAALDLFARKGYVAATVDEIARSVGSSRATFYLHFSGKAKVVQEFYELEWMPGAEKLYGRLDEHAARDDRKGIRAWMTDALEFHEQFGDQLQFLAEAAIVDPEISRQRQELIRRCIGAMPEYLARWTGAQADIARFKLELLMTQLNRFAMSWVAGEVRLSREVALDVLADIWQQGLNAEAGAPGKRQPAAAPRRKTR